jgi:hypothetical protein
LDLGQKVPSYRVVRSVVKTIPADLLALAHEGKKAYSEAFELVCRREADRPNAIWQADHSLLDILIHCETERPVKNVKPWLTIIISMTTVAPSRVITCLSSRPLLRRRLLRYARPFSANKIPVGKYAVFQTSSIPITAGILLPVTSSKSALI